MSAIKQNSTRHSVTKKDLHKLNKRIAVLCSGSSVEPRVGCLDKDGGTLYGGKEEVEVVAVPTMGLCYKIAF